MSRCCQCQTSTDPACRTSITSADLATLIYVQGLDINLCTKFQAIASLLQLEDCLGNPIAIDTPIVTCAAFASRLCLALNDLASGGTAVVGVTELVGSDCLTHVLPVPATACEQIATFPAGPAVVLGVTPLVGNDCLTHVVPETPLTVVDTATVDLTSSGAFGHTLQADVKISAFPGNEIVALVDGIYAPDVGIVVSDTACLDLNIVEAPPGTFTLSGSPIISPNPGNTISCAGNGLFVPAGAVTDTIIIGVDTPCFDITVVEAPADTFTISGSPVVSPNADNSLSCLPNGLFVPDVSIAVQDTDCIDLEVVEGPGNNDFVITANINVSAAPGNTISCIADGLYASGTGSTVIGSDTACIDISVVEAPPDTFTISAVPIISPLPGNTITCVASGLFVPTAAAFAVTATDTNCINATATPTGPNSVEISAVPIIANTYPAFPANCNPLLCTASGLAVPPDHTTLRQEVGTIGPGFTQSPFTPPDSIPFTQATVNISNPSLCRSMVFFIDTRIPEVNITATPAVPSRTHIVINHNFNFPTIGLVTGTVLKTEWWFDSEGGQGTGPDVGNPGGSITNSFILGPGEAGVYFVNGFVEQQVGTALEVDMNDLVVQVIGWTV